MSGVPEHRGLMRNGLVGSLVIHLALAFLPWGDFFEGAGEEPARGGSFEVSLIPGVSGGEEAPGEPAEVAPPPAEAVPPPDPVESAKVEPEPTEPATDGSVPTPQDASELPTAAATGTATAGGGGATAPGEESEGVSAAGLNEPPAVYRPPRVLGVALPIDPDHSEELDVPPKIPVRLRIGKDGTVKEIVPSDPDLSPLVLEALERSARAMKFIPARRGDRVVEGWFTMTFEYRK